MDDRTSAQAMLRVARAVLTASHNRLREHEGLHASDRTRGVWHTTAAAMFNRPIGASSGCFSSGHNACKLRYSRSVGQVRLDPDPCPRAAFAGTSV